MQTVANAKGGGFYYIQNIEEVNIAFADALGQFLKNNLQVV